ncbi:helix-turn-helix domain-containing protein [Streptomyces sp. NPDC059740]|uniref:helix-turn-helix domain-containing protein n=1 Tax=Streptomyces sp. NPDC059740 TaxID=3346926 RepID=UPI003650853C
MGSENPSALARPQSGDHGDPPPLRATARPRVRPTAPGLGGVIHENTRHTRRFTVVGNHLAQHAELSLLAIGLAVHIQSLPPGARVDIKTLAHRFPEGATRIAAALRELEAHGYLRRTRERTPAGRVVTRTVSCNQPGAARRTPERPPLGRHATPPPRAAAPHDAVAGGSRPTRRKALPLPAVPQPVHTTPGLLQTAADLLAGLRRHDARLTLSGCDTAHLAPGIAAWLEREVPASAVVRVLTTGLPPDGPRRPAALLAHRLSAHLPSPLPSAAHQGAPPPLHNCDGCDRAFRAPEPGLCRDCRTAAGCGGTTGLTSIGEHRHRRHR